MKLLNTGTMRELDKTTITVMNIPGAVLMQNAGNAAADAAMRLCPNCTAAAVICGPGNNGGDGFAAAARLYRFGVTSRVFLLGDAEKLSSDAKKMAENLQDIVIEQFTGDTNQISYILGSELIIDALFGIGLSKPLSGDPLLVVRTINNSRAVVVSCDIPSGVNADTGAVMGDAVEADFTVTFTAGKPGLFSEPGCLYAGEVEVCDIGVPFELVEAAPARCSAVQACDISLPKRHRDSHKGDYGKCFVLAGSSQYIGAPILASRAALRMGVGLLYLGVPESIYDITAGRCVEEIVRKLPSNKKGALADDAATEVLVRLDEFDACLIGPGLGRDPETFEFVRTIISNSCIPLVIDADGINAIAGNIHILDEASCPIVLTPHAGEFDRICSDTHLSRIERAQHFSAQHDCILVLKGHRTITAAPDGTVYLNTTGGPALSKGGSGDVLAGIIVSLIAQGFPLHHAAAHAVCLAGLCGDMCAEKLGEYSVLASDVIEMLPYACKSISEMKI